jgi:phosphatidylglycerophosphate synthase
VLALDGVDGWVARRFHAESELGAAYDSETDAFLVLALCVLLVHEARAGAWVIVAGLWRYGYVLLLDAVPAEHGEAPRSHHARVVFVGLVGCLAGAFVAPPAIATSLAAIGTVVITASFGRSLGQSYRRGRGSGAR